MTTVTQKGQITLPKVLRELVDISKYDTVRISLKKGYLRVEPVEDILDIAGKYRAKKGQSALKARALMEKQYKRV